MQVMWERWLRNNLGRFWTFVDYIAIEYEDVRTLLKMTFVQQDIELVPASMHISY